jgi:plasmid stabilization system protein ParE
MKRLVFSEKSLQDIEGLVTYIARDKPEAAILFGESIIEACERLPQSPDIGARREDLLPQLGVMSHGLWNLLPRA